MKNAEAGSHEISVYDCEHCIPRTLDYCQCQADEQFAHLTTESGIPCPVPYSDCQTMTGVLRHTAMPAS